MIEAKQPAEPLATLDTLASPRDVARRFDEPVPDSLVIALSVVVRDVLTDRSPKVRFADRDDLRQTLRLDRSNESLRIRVEIRAAAREPYGMHTRALERCAKRLCEERVSVVNEVAAPEKESVFAVCPVSSDLVHPGSAR